MRTPNSECCICKKKFYRRLNEKNNSGLYFCVEHRSQAIKQNKELFNLSGLDNGRNYWKGKKIDFVKPRVSKKYYDMKCLTCGVEYKITEADHKILNRGSYCSRKCYLSNPRLTNTDIEIILEKWLLENEIQFVKHKTILRTTPDFFIDPNICLYADGDYWHNKPKRKEQDEAINKRLNESGYAVIRLKGSEIYNGKRPSELLSRNT